jgi:hypothetical protein
VTNEALAAAHTVGQFADIADDDNPRSFFGFRWYDNPSRISSLSGLATKSGPPIKGDPADGRRNCESAGYRFFRSICSGKWRTFGGEILKSRSS